MAPSTFFQWHLLPEFTYAQNSCSFTYVRRPSARLRFGTKTEGGTVDGGSTFSPPQKSCTSLLPNRQYQKDTVFFLPLKTGGSFCTLASFSASCSKASAASSVPRNAGDSHVVYKTAKGDGTYLYSRQLSTRHASYAVKSP